MDFIFFPVLNANETKRFVVLTNNIFIKVQYGIPVLLHVRLPTLSCTLLMDDLSNHP